MLLIVTERGDLTADWLILELEARAAPFVRFNTEDYPEQVALCWSPEGSALRIDGASYELSGFDAVWYRRPVAPRMRAGLAPELAAWASREAWEALRGLWRTMDHALWVNAPDANARADSKPEQLCTAAQFGLEVPDSLITGERDELEAFAARHRAGIVCKPLWDGKLPGERLFFTTPLDARSDLEALGPEPYLFQERVAKACDVRVTVIGGEAFAVRIESQGTRETATDWRRSRPGQLRHEREELPAPVADACVALCEHYDLRFAAIDLARRPDGGYTFFEVNPNGQWAWIEQLTGVPLRARLADLLLAPAYV